MTNENLIHLKARALEVYLMKSKSIYAALTVKDFNHFCLFISDKCNKWNENDNELLIDWKISILKQSKEVIVFAQRRANSSIMFMRSFYFNELL